DLELQDRIVGLAASVALTLLGLRRGHALDVSAEVLPPHDLLDRFQRITFGADRLKPALNIEKARLPHDSLAPSAHGPLPSASQIRSDLARRIFRGALKYDGGVFGRTQIGCHSDDTFSAAQRLGVPSCIAMKSLSESAT